MIFKCRKRTEVMLDLVRKIALGPAIAIRRKILPEDGMQNMAGNIKRQRAFEHSDFREIIFLLRLMQFIQRLIRAVYIRSMMLIMMKLHNLTGNVRFQRAIIIRKVGQYVFIQGKAPFPPTIAKIIQATYFSLCQKNTNSFSCLSTS